MLDALDHFTPLRKVGRRRIDLQLSADNARKMRLLKIQRRFVQRFECQILDHAVPIHVAEVCDLFKNTFIGDRFVAAQHENVGRNAHALQLLDRMLRRLGFVLAACPQIGNERDMDEQRVAASHLSRHLPDRFQKRLSFDIADRAADLRDHNIRVGVLSDAIDEPFDFVCDVRDRLHGLAKIAALPFARKHIGVHLAGRQVGIAVQVLVDEPFVMAEVEIGFRAVLRHIHFTVLIRAHRARIDVDVRVQFLRGDLKPARLQKPSERRRRNALAEPGHHAAGHKDVFFRPALLRHSLSLPDMMWRFRIG